MIWIAVDAMGGDEAPSNIVDGALAASRHFDLGVALVGPASRLEAEVARHPSADRARVRIVDADAVVEMAESPAAALRRKPTASIKVAAELVARGEAAALFSAGHRRHRNGGPWRVRHGGRRGSTCPCRDDSDA